MQFALHTPNSGFCKGGLMEGQLAETCRDKYKIKIYCCVWL